MSSLTSRAESALIGALLADPRNARDIPPLGAGDFASPERGALFATIATQAGSDPGWTWAPGAMVGDTGPHYLRTLVRACPQPENADWYARLVMEAGLRRNLAVHARRLHAQAAFTSYEFQRIARWSRPGNDADLLSDEDLPDAIGGHSTAHEVSWQITEQAKALAAHAAAFDPDRESGPPRTAPSADIEMTVTARREEQLLAWLLRQHTRPPNLGVPIQPEMITPGPRRELYAAIAALISRGEPVDELTADWERARRHTAATPQASSPPPDTSYASRLAGVRTGAVVDSSQQLLHEYQEPSHLTGRQRPQIRTAQTPGLLRPPDAGPRPAHEPRI
jgi:hypothetical protein